MTGAEFSRSLIFFFFVATRGDRRTCDTEEMKSTIGENSLRYVQCISIGSQPYAIERFHKGNRVSPPDQY